MKARALLFPTGLAGSVFCMFALTLIMGEPLSSFSVHAAPLESPVSPCPSGRCYTGQNWKYPSDLPVRAATLKIPSLMDPCIIDPSDPRFDHGNDHYSMSAASLWLANANHTQFLEIGIFKTILFPNSMPIIKCFNFAYPIDPAPQSFDCQLGEWMMFWQSNSNDLLPTWRFQLGDQIVRKFPSSFMSGGATYVKIGGETNTAWNDMGVAFLDTMHIQFDGGCNWLPLPTSFYESRNRLDNYSPDPDRYGSNFWNGPNICGGTTNGGPFLSVYSGHHIGLSEDYCNAEP